MKIKIIPQFIVAMIILCFFVQGTFAYAPATTHAGLTQEIVAYYEAVHGDVFSHDEGELVIQGSIDEDNPSARALNHFYDPIHGTGINAYRSAVIWATDKTSTNNFTWTKGIDAYAHGDTRTAYVTLGHVLHLVEDSSVPDHTRNDPHMGHDMAGLYTGASPFEDWANSEKTRTTLTKLGTTLYQDGFKENTCTDIFDCFSFIASYSNGNFFSEDSIAGQGAKYSIPLQTRSDARYGYGKDVISGKEVKLFIYKQDGGGNRQPTLVNDSDHSVLSEYFDRLAPQAVGVGSRVISLYLAEAQVAREKYIAEQKWQHNAALRDAQALNDDLKNKGTFGLLVFGLKDLALRPVSMMASLGQKTVNAGGKTVHSLAILSSGTQYGATLVVGSSVRTGTYLGAIAINTAKEKNDEGQAIAKKAIGTVVSKTQATTQMVNDILRELVNQKITTRTQASSAGVPVCNSQIGEVAGASIALSPYVFSGNSLGSGGDGGGGTVIFLADVSVAIPPILPHATTTLADIAPIDITPPDAPIIQSPTEAEISTTTTLTISGVAEAGAVVALSWLADTVTMVFETRATTSGAWSAQVLLPLGTTTIGAVAIDDAGNSSHPTFRNVFVAHPSPVVVPSLPVTQHARVLFNEIAWGGTDASHEDEWIELYNAGDAPADLSYYSIRFHSGGSGDEWASTTLRGILGPGQYFVVQRSAGSIDPRVPESRAHLMILMNDPLISAMPILPDTGMKLELVDASTGAPVLADRIPFCADWCGKGTPGVSMERWRTELGGDAWGNWDTNDGNFSNGLDRNGNGILGTPGARNALNYQLSLSNTIEGMQTFAKGQGAYVLFSALTIPVGSSLTLGAGTVVKWMPTTGKLAVFGTLTALGNSEEPVVFTAIDDDSAGGDTLVDGEEPIRRDNSTRAITLSGPESTALFFDTEIRHAGTALHMSNHASATMVGTTITETQHAIFLTSSTLLGTDTSFFDITGNTIVAFASSSITLASTIVSRTDSDAFVLFDGTSLSLATTTFTRVSGVGIDAFGSSVNATNTVFNEVYSTKNAIDLFTNRAGKASVGNFDGVTILNMGAGDVFNMLGSHATVTNMVVRGGEDDAITLFARSTLFVSSSTIENFVGSAILLFNSTVHADDVTLSNNAYGIRSFNSVVDIENSVITENTTAGVANATPTVGAPLSATQNYWGDTAGPTSPSMPAGSAGDAVTLGVLTDPFLPVAPE